MSSPVFNEAAASFIVPLSLLTINLIAYLHTDDALLAGVNCFFSIYLLGYYFGRDNFPPPITDGDIKSPQNSEPEMSTDRSQKKFFSKIMFGVLICVGLSVPIASLYILAGDIYYGYADLDFPYNPPCGYLIGEIGTKDAITYSYQKWDNCDVATDLGAIARAVTKHIDENGHRISHTECLELREGDSHNGYLLVGPSDAFDISLKCEPERSDPAIERFATGFGAMRGTK